MPRVRPTIGQRAGAGVALRNRTRSGPPASVRGKTGKTVGLADGEFPILDLIKAAKPPYRGFREGKYTHVSDIISKCGRKIALIRRMGTSHASTRLMDGHAITFAIGDAVHDFIKKRFTESHPEKVWAKWRCACGGTTTEAKLFADISTKDECPTCNQIPYRYVEVVFEDDEHEVVGSPDLLLYFEDSAAFYVTEVKSMAAKMWDELERPVPDHIIQGLFYWMLMRSKGYSMIDQFSILYVKKEYTWKLPYKEFIIKPLEQMHRLKEFLAELTVIADARHPGNPLPKRVVCSSNTSSDAKECPVCVTCFQLP